MFVRRMIFLGATLFAFVSSAAAQTGNTKGLTNPKIVVSYGSADGKPETLKWLKDRAILERVAQFLSPIKLPRVLTITSGGPATKPGCPENEPNMYFSPAGDELVVCYSYIEWWKGLVAREPALKGITKQDVLAGGLAGVLLHEAGHAVSHMLNLPVLGREEDAADQISAILMVQFSPGLSKAALRGFAYILLRFGDDMPDDASATFHGVHGTPLQRFYNTICIAYGKDPDEYRSIARLAKFPESRLANCEREYGQIKHAYTQTIAPHLDLAKVEKVKLVNWISGVNR